MIKDRIINHDGSLIGKKVIFKTASELDKEFGFRHETDEYDDDIETEDFDTYYPFTTDMDFLCGEEAIIKEINDEHIALRMLNEKVILDDDCDISSDMLWLIYEDSDVLFNELLIG